MAKKKQTKVTEQIGEAKTIRHQKLLPGLPADRYDVPMPRLSIGLLTPRESTSFEEIRGLITNGNLRSQSLFFDTGFVTTAAPDAFWRFPENQHLIFPEMISSELTGWRKSPRANSTLHSWLADALDRCDASPTTDSPNATVSVLAKFGNHLTQTHVSIQRRDKADAFGFSYYVDLLSLRKRTGGVVHDELVASAESSQTRHELANELQRRFSPRLAAVALKGHESRGKRNFDADEQLVVGAYINAIMTGMTTTILTRDNDTFDLFVKMFEVISTDYRCFRFAEVEHYGDETYIVDDIPTPDAPRDREYFASDCIGGVVMPNEEVDRLPPHEHTPVHCFCVLVGNTRSDPTASFVGVCLEEEMAPLLIVKGKTGGMNTERFGDRNVIIGFDPKMEPQTGFFRGVEQEITYGGVKTTPADLERSLRDIAFKEVSELLV